MSNPDEHSRTQQGEAARAAREEQERTAAQGATRRKRLTVLAGVVATAVVLAAVLLLVSSPDKAKTPTTATGETVAGQTATAALLDGIPQSGRTLGAARARVTLVEFADLQCPFCAQYTRDALPTVIGDYVRTGKVRLEFRPRAFIGPDSERGARTVVAAGRQDKLWNVLELLYANQGAENSGWLSDDLAVKVLAAAAVDPPRLERDASSAAVGKELTDAEALAARNGLDSTPSFLVGRTGGALKPLVVQELTGTAFSQALDQAGA